MGTRMKTLILYASKTGVTETCATYIKEKLGHATLVNTKKETIDDISIYDQIVIGTPIYVSQSMKSINSFVANHKEVLLTKDLYLFTCGAEATKEPRFFLDVTYGEDICNHATMISYFGTELRYQKMDFFSRMIMKAIAKKHHLNPTIDYEKMDGFVENILEV